VSSLGITEILFVGDKGVQMKPRGSSQLFSGGRSLRKKTKHRLQRDTEKQDAPMSAMDDPFFSLLKLVVVNSYGYTSCDRGTKIF
jgi:hypothetical protein